MLTQHYVWSGGSMVYEYESLYPTNGTVYVYGINLISSRDSGGNEKFYLYNGRGDVVQLVDNTGTVIKEYSYDAFGNEKNPDPNDTNYFRYCGEYYDWETGTYYLRARYYNPVIGRFLNEDTHWNPSNMIYGDNPVKWNERQEDEKDPLGLNTYKYKPDITAIIQSNNLYIYCMDNPLMYQDANGEFAQALLWGAGAANAWNPVGWVLLGAAAVLTVATVVVVVDCASQQIKNNHKSKPPSLPSVSKVKIDMDHIMSGHGAGGNRGGPNKDRFPWEMTSPMIEKVIREAYKAAEKIGPMQTSWENGKEMVRQFFQGIVDDQIVQFWYNYTTNTIETAWPK
jgi:RHS repeat-associated protein